MTDITQIHHYKGRINHTIKEIKKRKKIKILKKK